MNKGPWKILTHPNPDLRHRSEEVDVEEVKTPEFQEFVDAFTAFMVESDGIGLAAPQIGIKKRIIAVQEKEQISVYINPEILKASKITNDNEEGCLSVPEVYGMVERPKRIKVRAIDRLGRKMEFDISGFPAAVIQHEIDHLDGILFIDKVKEITRGSI